MTKKIILPIALMAIFISGIAIWQFPFYEKKDHSINSDKNSEPKFNGNPEHNINVEKKVTIKNNEKIQSASNNELTDSDKKDIADFHKQDTLTLEETNSDYTSYSDDLLANLADSGDLKAIKTLTARNIEKANNSRDLKNIAELMEKNSELINKSVVYGDREFFEMIPEKSKAITKLVDPVATPEQKHEATIEALAYSEFMALRGDVGKKYEDHRNLYNTYGSYGLIEHLTDTDKEKIRKKAKEIYDNYEAQRIKIGLGPFDNSAPAGKEKVFKILEQQYKQEMKENAF